ncbi:MAG: hypothetical protein PHT28_04745 [Dehalococcoidales bacterium]|jgi:hypothetical protein|nr:hypothetical protein [Dehalococcoidales bacterium]MDD4230760.1 hypothetical protein [Dehalococcoidales bacterium]MDD4466035.1 hypothetical protein [Dehalococcoidales bacterium]MDD5402218.1 hypothetical protein [Dehalococcoidales bacterium]
MNKQSNRNSGENPESRFSYQGYLESPGITGEAKITVGEEAVLLSAGFDQVAVDYSDITEIKLSDYAILINTPQKTLALSRLGNECDWLFRDLHNAYNRIVLKALFVQGEVIMETSGEYVINEKGNRLQGTGVIQLYQDCVCILPPNISARRIPLSFVSDIKQDQYTVIIKLSSGESFSVSKLGFDTDVFTNRMTKQISLLKEKRLDFIRNLDPSMSMSKSIEVVQLMPAYQTVQFDKLSSGYLTLAAVIRNSIKASRIADTFDIIPDICDSKQLLISIKERPATADDEQQPGISSDIEDNDPQESEAESLKYSIWCIAPDKNHQMAILELSLPEDQSAATYVYRTEGNFDELVRIINRSLEAVSFRREYITVTEEKLQDDKYAKYRMLIERTPVLSILRQRFVTRIIHSSPEKWKAEVKRLFTSVTSNAANQPEILSNKYCAACGAILAEDSRYCGGCGLKI